MSIFGLPYRIALQIVAAKIGNYCWVRKRLGQMSENRAGNEEDGSSSHQSHIINLNFIEGISNDEGIYLHLKWEKEYPSPAAEKYNG